MKDVEPSIEKMNKILRESMDTIQNKTQKCTIKKSTEDTEIESLDKKRKENIKDRICRTQQMSQKETLNKSTDEQQGINTGKIRSKKGPKTDQ